MIEPRILSYLGQLEEVVGERVSDERGDVNPVNPRARQANMRTQNYLERPAKEAIRELPKFKGLTLEQIIQVRTSADLDLAHREITACTHVGFDTESKPNFVANQPQTGPHLVQIATPNYAFLFAPDHAPDNELLTEIIQSPSTTKVGFGLKSDRGPIHRKLGVKLCATIDLSDAVRRLGYRQKVGLQAAVAIVLGQYLEKSKSVTTSNWAIQPLSAPQKLYAANDAYASLCVYRELATSLKGATLFR